MILPLRVLRRPAGGVNVRFRPAQKILGISSFGLQNHGMDTKSIQRVNVDDIWAMILTSWGLIKDHLGVAVVLGFFLAFAGLASAAPFIGALIGGAIGALAPLVFLKAASQWEKGQEGEIPDLLKVVQNKALRDRMLPLMLLHFAAYAAPALIAQLPFLHMMMGSIHLFTFPLMLWLGVAYPVLFFNSDLTYQKALTVALDGIVKNMGPFLLGACMLVALLVVSAILFVLPLFFVGLPIYFVFYYVWYRVIHEGMQLDLPDKAII
jgi:hypothetical protein